MSRKKALIKGIIRAKFRINQTFSNDKSEINSRAGKIRENTKLMIILRQPVAHALLNI